MARRVLLSALLALSASLAAADFAASSSSECCSTCIGKTSSTPYTYDPVIYAQCTNVTDGICCFDCGSLGEPEYGATVSYGSDGTTAVAKTGTYISFTWTDVVNVTYVALKSGQKKTVTPSLSDSAATLKSSTFLICAKTAGTIYFRGWGSDSCREASPEKSITIEASDSGADTCDASDVTVTTASSAGGSSSADETVADCNDQRASVQTVDGVRTCVCVSDWSNPPACDQWPVWKWLVTIGGGVAAAFSIIISVRAFLNGRKKKQQAEEMEESLAPVGAKSDVETLQVTPDRGYHGAAMTPFKYDPEADRQMAVAIRKPDEREFTL